MKLPRDVSGEDIAKALTKFGYIITRQTGSHLRLTTQLSGEHHITIPNHKEVKTGTLSSIIKDVAEHFNISKDEVIRELY